MTVGTPDYGILAGQINEATAADMLELAARLGAIETINRTGQHVFEFGDAMLYANNAWSSSDGNGNWEASSMYGNYNRPALKVSTSTTNGASAGVYMQVPAVGSKQIGMASFMICSTFNCSIQLWLYNYIGGTRYVGGIQVDLSTGVVSYWNSGGTWSTIGTYKVPNQVGQPLAVKFTVDFNALKYGKLYLGNEAWIDISAYVPQSSATATMDFSMAFAQITNLTAATNAIYFANHVVTINEVI